jgi:hypothetical protein
LNFSRFSNNDYNKNFFLVSLDNPVQPEVLLIYVYSKTNSHAYENLKYFIKHAVRENDGVDYYFILQNVDNKTVDEHEMPILPKKNARYIQHENLCFDLGTVGWFLSTHTVGNPWVNYTATAVDQKKKINITYYKYFLFMNSSIRGPYFPPYYLKFLADYKEEFEKSFHWYYIFTKRINEKVKLVGCTISCTPLVHLQTYLFMTDLVGLSILLQPTAEEDSKLVGLFRCFTEKIHAALHIELTSSIRIFEAGYMIDCLLTKYQEVDFTQQHNKLCSQYLNPYSDNNLDGTVLEPYEVVFMKYNDIPDTQRGKQRLKLYDKWMEESASQNRSNW